MGGIPLYWRGQVAEIVAAREQWDYAEWARGGDALALLLALRGERSLNVTLRFR
jgi:hypothetical protein